MLKKFIAPKSPLLGSTAAEMEKAKQELAKTELPTETDPDIVEMRRQKRRMALKQKGVASTILTGGQLADDGYQSGTVLG